MGMARSMAVTETLGGDLFSRRLGGGRPVIFPLLHILIRRNHLDTFQLLLSIWNNLLRMRCQTYPDLTPYWF